MDNLPFAVYSMGFEEGIRQWQEYLKPGGYLAVSEITWFTRTRPSAIEAHWQAEYPKIVTAAVKIMVMEENGFTPVGYFILPASSWIDNYYKPTEKRMDGFLAWHHHSEMAVKLVEAEKEEFRKYQLFEDYYSYGFYVGKNKFRGDR